MAPEFPEGSAGADHDTAPVRRSPLKFEPVLVPRLRAAHATLNQRFAELIGLLQGGPAANVRAIEDCSKQFVAIRHIETAWLFPMLAQAVEGDAYLRGQVVELRLVALMLARRTQRCFDDLLQAARVEVLVADAITRATSALANYSSHSDRVVYPLYELIGTQSRESVQVA